jgi:hypothetical protein
MLMMAAVRFGPALGFGICESVVYRRMRYWPGAGYLDYTVVCGSIMRRLVAGTDSAWLQLWYGAGFLVRCGGSCIATTTGLQTCTEQVGYGDVEQYMRCHMQMFRGGGIVKSRRDPPLR